MGAKQADVFGGYKEIKEKPKKNAPKKYIKLKEKIKILYRLYAELYKRQNVNVLEQRDKIIKNGIVIYPHDQQAEPIELIYLGIQEIDKKIMIMQKVLNNDRFRI